MSAIESGGTHCCIFVSDIQLAMGPTIAKGVHPREDALGTPLSVPLTFMEKMFAGAIARGVAQTVLHPVDVVRTRLQARDVVRNWRPEVFIKGVIPQITLAIPAGAIQFVAFEAAKEKLMRWFPDSKVNELRILAAGAIGALAAATCRIPQEVLKQRVQADVFPNVFVAVRETIRMDGIAGLYNGWLATISRDVPWNALSFMFHGQGKRIFKSAKGRDPANDENLAIAGVAGAIAAIIMTPIDVVKTRIMTQRAGAAQYSGIVGTLRKIVAEEGAGTLMKGVIPRVVFLAPLAGVTFSVYEAVAANIRKRKMASTDVASSSVGATLPLASFSSRAVRVTRRNNRLVAMSRNPYSASGGHDTLAHYCVSRPIFFSAPV